MLHRVCECARACVRVVRDRLCDRSGVASPSFSFSSIFNPNIQNVHNDVLQMRINRNVMREQICVFELQASLLR